MKSVEMFIWKFQKLSLKKDYLKYLGEKYSIYN